MHAMYDILLIVIMLLNVYFRLMIALVSQGCLNFNKTHTYLFQSDREKEEGLPVAPFMDRDKVTKPAAQIGFIKFVLLPMFQSISKVTWLDGNVPFSVD
jgi:hypothetical protein